MKTHDQEHGCVHLSHLALTSRTERTQAGAWTSKSVCVGILFVYGTRYKVTRGNLVWAYRITFTCVKNSTVRDFCQLTRLEVQLKPHHACYKTDINDEFIHKCSFLGPAKALVSSLHGLYSRAINRYVLTVLDVRTASYHTSLVAHMHSLETALHLFLHVKQLRYLAFGLIWLIVLNVNDDKFATAK